MEARLIRATLAVAAVLSLGASHRTENFIVTASTAAFARQVADTAEQLRRDLAVEWLGRELPPWQDKCPITVHAGPQYGAGGATSFMFSNGQPFGWTMTIQGSPERVLDSVLPHEITHTIFATHFGRPLPRWADEGACTTVEDISERQKQHNMLYEFLTTQRGIAFNDMFAMKEYPPDVLPLYAQGYSLARFLIAQGGKRKFLNYVGDGMKWNNWTKASAEHYGYRSLSELQVTWLEWVRRGSPERTEHSELLAQATPSTTSQGEAGAAGESSAQTADTLREVTLVSAPPESGSGWYARVRDETLAARARPASAESAAATADTAVSHDAADHAVVPGGSIARPQGIGRPQQIILQWSSSASLPAAAAASPAGFTAPAASLPMSTTQRLVPNFGRTLWR